MSLRIGIGLGLIPTAARPSATTAPVNVEKPFFAGILTQGQSADVNPGSWTGLPAANFAYAVKRGATTVSTDPAYVWTSADVAAGAGAMTVAVTATNDIGPTTETSDPATIAGTLQLSGSPPTAIVGVAYSFVPTRGGGHGPFGFTLTGTLPSGLSFDAETGGIEGTAVASGSASLTIGVVDVDGLTASLGPFTLTVTAETIPGAALIGLPTAPAARWHPGFSTVTKSAGKVTVATDLMGLAGATEGAAGVGPVEMIDALGRKFWRFEGAAFLNIATTLSLASRSMAVFAVGRIHRNPTTCAIFGAGNVAAGTAVNNQGANLDVYGSGGAAPTLRCHGVNSNTDAANKSKMVAGSQLQVLGSVGRPTAAGGSRFYVNTDAANAAQPFSTTGTLGGEIGRYPWTPGASGAWAVMDLYELSVFNTVLTNAEADAVAAALTTGWGIKPSVNQMVVDGDSITQGWAAAVTPGQNLAMRLTDPGVAGAVPAGWRVVNMGVSGNKVADLVTRRDNANSIYDLKLSGRNVVAVQVGANDWSVSDAATIYGAIVALLNTASTGYLQRGWEVRQAINIATANGIKQPINASIRAMLRAGQFLTDSLTGPGQTYDGKLKLIELPAISVGGDIIFDTAADAANGTYYFTDQLHPTVLGTSILALGGDTPSKGYVGAIAA